ncbi:bZIP transcription factor 2-like [Durio zibethinus]|uniref:BZIP transcription factor 2-like n=1 Tax=Durio zibethinus TaxID=66656 RepID=A0A6P6B9P5_DURZI|nr:bZIP transcription factor 2-like [Durio zibethinus]
MFRSFWFSFLFFNFIIISKAMLSTVPTTFFSDSILDSDLFPAFESGFTPWDCSDFFSNSPSIGPVISASGSDELNQNQTNSNSSGLVEPNQPVPIIDERKRRRMISNRESARRSRMRKQKHLENLRNEVNQFRIENRELTNRLRFVWYHCHRVRTDNRRLHSEYSMLRQKLSDLRQILLFKQLQQFSSAWPCNNVAIMSEQIPPLIT